MLATRRESLRNTPMETRVGEGYVSIDLYLIEDGYHFMLVFIIKISVCIYSSAL